LIAGYLLIAVCSGLAGCTLLWSSGLALALSIAPLFGSGAVFAAAAVASSRSRRRAAMVAVRDPLPLT
jgi:hypothetical protein